MISDTFVVQIFGYGRYAFWPELASFDDDRRRIFFLRSLRAYNLILWLRFTLTLTKVGRLALILQFLVAISPRPTTDDRGHQSGLHLFRIFGLYPRLVRGLLIVPNDGDGGVAFGTFVLSVIVHFHHIRDEVTDAQERKAAHSIIKLCLPMIVSVATIRAKHCDIPRGFTGNLFDVRPLALFAKGAVNPFRVKGQRSDRFDGSSITYFAQFDRHSLLVGYTARERETRETLGSIIQASESGIDSNTFNLKFWP